jgi:hypothetical protein
VRIALAGLLLVLGADALGAQKADSVWIRNGDRITGEVKSLSRALLKYSTDDLGTVYIEWDKVDRISTRTILEVQLRSGQKFYGSLDYAASGRVVLGADTLPLTDVVALIPIERRMLSRLSGYLDLGFSFQTANSILQLSTGGKLAYRGPRAEAAVQLSTFVEDRDDDEPNSRLSVGALERVLLPDRWSTGVLIGYDKNDELDLAGRTRIVGFGERMLVQSNHLEFRTSGGLAVAQERYLSADSSSGSFEGLIGAVFRAYRYDRPKLDASWTVEAFPSFTIRGRWRLQNDVRLSYELIKDFMVTATMSDAFDSKPPSEGAPKHDFWTTLALSWTF